MAKGLVLVFHKEENGQLFESIILALKAKYTLVSLLKLESLLTGNSPLENICHISFDDGVRSFYTTIFPLLKKYQVPVSLFVSPDIITRETNFWFQEAAGYDENIIKGILSEQLNIAPVKLDKFSSQSILKCLPVQKIKNIIELYQQQTKCRKKAPQNMNADQLKEVAASGLVTIGAHTINHPVLKNEDDESCNYEIVESIKGLEALLGQPVQYFAYPNGRPGIDFDEREKNYLKANKISLAFSTELDHLSSKTNLLSIPRMGFARMGLSPSNPLVSFRLNAGKKWIDIKSIGKPSEKNIRGRIKAVMGS
jgi:peptidoglycan/xylan/chitin deacetylase (PgdA/CDA1 family)